MLLCDTEKPVQDREGDTGRKPESPPDISPDMLH